MTNRAYNNKNSGCLQIALTQALCTSLQNVSLDQCGLGDHEANAIAEALSKNNYLKSISIKSNGIKNSGAIAIFQSFKYMSCGLEQLDISENLFDDEAGKDLVEAIRSKNRYLLRIIMKKNQILNYGKPLLAAIKFNTQI